jgi:hypothetical protein
VTALDKAFAVLRIYCAGQGNNEFLDRAEAELRRLHEENERLRALIRLDDAEIGKAKRPLDEVHQALQDEAEEVKP